MVDRGVDTIAYVPDIATQTVMYNVVEDSPHFTLDTIKTSIAPQLALYVGYNQTNDNCPKKFLLNSISKELLLVLCLRIKDTDPFPVVWMLFLALIQPHRVTRFENLKEKIRSHAANQYPGDNISLLTADYLLDAKELDKAGQYDHSLTRSMMLAFIGTGGVGATGELFHKPFLDHFTKLEAALLCIPFLDKATADIVLCNANLHFEQLCLEAYTNYENSMANNEWEPAMNTPDKRGIPSSFK